MKIGYARVSTEEQNLDLQLDALNAAGCQHTFRDEGVSAVAESRPGFRRALKRLNAGDTLVIWKLDRAFRSTLDAIVTLNDLRARGVEFQCVTMQIDTSTPEGRKWYCDTAFWAEYERELISQRTRAGLAAAKRRGKHIGRPRKLTEKQINHARMMIESDQATISHMAGVFGVDKSTLWRALNTLRSVLS